MKKCIGRSMRRTWIFLIGFVLLYLLQPLLVFGSPILPDEVERNFGGVFRWANIDASYGEWIGEVPIVGIATFLLLEQTHNLGGYGFEYQDYVTWGISVETFDESLRFYGQLNNEDSFDPDNLSKSSLTWGPGNWDNGPGGIEEAFSGLTWRTDYRSGIVGAMSGSAWNLIDNSHFLPEQARFCQKDINGEYYAEVNIAFAPVPEPGTIFLVASGLLGLAVFARKWRN